MIEVFRVEHRHTHLGPFQTPLPYLQMLAERAGKVSGLRLPHDDGLGLAWIPWTFVFGSPSLDTLKRWILLGGSIAQNSAIVNKLAELGFVVAEYLVEEDLYRESISGLQVAFDAKTARQEGLVRYHEMSVLMAQSPLVFDLGRPAVFEDFEELVAQAA